MKKVSRGLFGINKNNFFTRVISILTGVILAASLTLGLSTPSFASGGGYDDYNFSQPAKPRFDNEKYNLGKKVFRNKVNCATCPVNDASLTHKQAKALHKQIRRGKEFKQLLSKKERKAVSYYMKKRFNV